VSPAVQQINQGKDFLRATRVAQTMLHDTPPWPTDPPCTALYYSKCHDTAYATAGTTPLHKTAPAKTNDDKLAKAYSPQHRVCCIPGPKP
jgi:hypothetical protein